MKKLRALIASIGLVACLSGFASLRDEGRNPNDPALVALGERLFNDARLSVDGTVACATCHIPEKAFHDGLTLARGVHGLEGARNTPTLLDVARLRVFFWDGRADTLEAQALGPLTNAREMGQPDVAAVEKAVRSVPEYMRDFDELFGEQPRWDNIAQALVAYERTLVTDNAPFDRYLAGDTNAVSPRAQQGWALFNGKARCVLCHTVESKPATFTDNLFHNVGIGFAGEGFVPLAQRVSNVGRMAISKLATDKGAFRTTPLRNVGITAPYMHDGSLATLWDVMDHYNRGGDRNPRIDGLMRELKLSEDEIVALVTWMFTLTDDTWQALNDSERTRQFALQDVRPERGM